MDTETSYIGTRNHSRKTFGASSNRDSDSSRRTTRDPGSRRIAASTISFTTTATIEDSGSGFTFAVGDVIEVQGSATNNRRFVVTAASSSSLTVVPAVVRTAAASPVVYIRKVG